MIDEPGEGKSAASARIERKFSITYDFKLLITFFKFAPFTSIVGASAKSHVRATPLDILTDPTVPFAIECPTVA